MKNLKFSIKSAFRLLALMLCLTMTVPQVGASNYTIYVRCSTPGDASSTNLYAWGDGISLGWPGTAISNFSTTTINGYTWYYTTLSSNDNTIGVIFNRNGSQTGNLTAYPGNNYYVYNGTTSVSYEYFVVGDYTDLFLNGWSRGNSTMMTGSGNNYTWTSGQVHLTQGTNYEYKVTGSDNSWVPSGNNAYFSVNTSGTYTVTITYNKSNGTVNATTNLIQADVTTTYYVVGDEALTGHNWSTANDTQMTKSNGTYTWSRTGFHLNAGNYNLKVRDSNNTDYGDANGNNVGLTASANGTYNLQVTFNSTTGIVSATLTMTAQDPVYTYDIYVRYTGSENVSDVFAYSFDSYGVNALGTWGGTRLTNTQVFTPENINGHTYYHTTITSYDPQAKIIFNEKQSSSTQTANLDLQTGNNYFTYGGGSTVSGPNAQADAADPTYDYTIYVRYKGNKTPYMYIWVGTNTELLGAFPGTVLANANPFTTETINGYTYYKYTLTGSSYASLGMILNEDHDGQTTDMSVSPGTSYYTYGGGNTYDGPKPQADPAITYYAESDFAGWNTTGNQMASNGDGSYSKTFTGVSLTGGTAYGYKVFGDDGTSNGVWYGDSQGNNATFTPSMSGTYDVTITLNSDGTISHTFTMTAAGTVYIDGDGILGSFTEQPNLAMTYTSDGIYTYTATLSQPATINFVFANGQGSDWNDFNNNYRIGPNSGDETYAINSGYTSTQMAGGDNGAYGVYAGAGTITFYLDVINMQYKVEGTVPPVTYYVMGNDTSIFPNGWNMGSGTDMAYDSNSDTHSWTSGQVQLTAGTNYEYKVHGDDGSWSPAEGQPNASFSPSVSGNYTVTIIRNSDGTVSHTLTLISAAPVYIDGDGILGGFTEQPNLAMTYTSNGIYTYTATLAQPATINFVFANGQGSDWNDFNSNYRIGPNSGDETYTINSGYTSTQMAGGDNGAYGVYAGAGTITFYLDVINMQYKVEGTVPPVTYYVMGNDTSIFPNGWNMGSGTVMAYDSNSDTHSWTSGQVQLTAGTNYEYKVHGDDGSWSPAEGQPNASFSPVVNGSYTVTIIRNSDGTVSHTLTLISAAAVYIDGDGILGGFTEQPNLAMTYTSNGIYTYTATLTQPATINFVFANGQGSDWNDFNSNYRIGPNNGDETYAINSGYTSTQMAGGDNGAYGVYAGAGQVIFYLDVVNMQYKVEGTVPPVTYYVVGQDTNIFPNGWNMGSGTDMTYDSNTNTYSWTSGQVQLTAGTNYEYKVLGDDGSWSPGEGQPNASFSPGVSGNYTVTIIRNSDGTVSHTLTLIQAAQFYITGSQGLGLGWSYAPETEMTFDSSTGYYTYTAHISEGGMYNFVFGNGQGTDWADFNSNYRYGPASSNNQAITPNGNWNSTQMANGNDGSYSITVNPGTVIFTFDPANSRFKVEGDALTHNYTFYVLPSDHSTTPWIYLWGLGTDETYSNTYPGTMLTTTEVLADGNTWYKLSVDLTAEYIHALVNGGINNQNADNTKTADITHIDPGTYYIYWTTVREDGEPYNDYWLTTVPPSASGGTLYMIGTYYYNKEQYHYSSNSGALMKYDANTNIYYLNNVNLAVHNTFCFTTQLSEDWSGVGNRYGNSGDNEHVVGDGVTNYFPIDENWVNKAIALDAWSDINGEYRMLVPGIYNVLVNLDEKWVKLIKTDYYELTPMNVFLEQTPNVTMSKEGNNFIQNPNTEYSTQIFGDGNWPLAAYNGNYGNGVWDPHDNGNKYPVTYVGDTTTVDGKTWWHWQVEASIAELFFTRLDDQPLQSDTLRRKAGVLWVTWDEVDGQATLTDHSREYFEAAANALPTNAVVMEGHYYVYFINTVDWEQVYCYAWDNNYVTPDSIDNTFYDGYSRLMSKWPGQPCECVGIDPVTGYEVWRYDFGTIIGTDIPNGGILFNDGNEYEETEAKEQTGDFEYVNGAVYDYLGMVDGAYTLNNLIRKGAKDVRYTVSNTLLGVYYDKDAVTTIEYKNEYEETVHEDIIGALYAKDLNLYGEKSVMPDASYTDYIYDICASDHTAGRSQVMIKKTTYDQSNWVKLVISPNYDGGGAVVPKDERPDLSKYVNHLIPAGKLDVFMTDSINPTAHVLRISMGDSLAYEPNVYVSEHFNDTIVFNYIHQDWLGDDAKFPYAYSCQPRITWDYDTIEDVVTVTGGTAVRQPNYSHPYKMFYVAPKPQEIAYITWVVYDNYNQDGTWQGYTHGQYTPYTRESVSETYPEDPGRFYSPMNWNRMVYIDPAAYPELSQITEATELEKKLGAWSPEYGPFSNGYMQYGGFKVNWSLFDMEASGGPWWQIIKPGQAYKFKAIIRYARGSAYSGMEGEINDTINNYYYGPSNGYFETEPNGELIPGPGTVFNAPRRSAEETGYANMYFTDYDYLTESKFIIFPIEASSSESNGHEMGNVTSVKEVITNVATSRTVSSVRYYNLMGAESDKPFDGINIMVITYSDGSRFSRKVLR